jgi:hypothetical protein
VILPVAAAAVIAMYFGAGQEYDVPLLVGAVLAGAAILFGSLTVTVDAHSIEARFGPGVIKRTFPLSQIKSARHVRHPWYYGWGYRKLPNGWLMNVSGFDCIEIEMKDGSMHRIGTDEPKRLLRHIEMKQGLSGSASRMGE